MHLIAVDVGNSRIKIGLFASASHRSAAPQPLRVETVDRGAHAPWSCFSEHLRGDRQVQGVIAATNPRQLGRIAESWPAEWIQPLQRVERNRLPIRTTVHAPERVGIDRLLNAIAANHSRSTDRGVIIVDSGTATTIDVISRSGEFEGGAILPGLALSARALHEYTALLPLVNFDAHSGPCQPVGRDTRTAIQSGLIWGQVGAIRELTSRYRQSLQDPPDIILTGGAAELLHLQFPEFALRRHLALEGLAIYASRPLEA